MKKDADTKVAEELLSWVKGVSKDNDVDNVVVLAIPCSGAELQSRSLLTGSASCLDVR